MKRRTKKRKTPRRNPRRRSTYKRAASRAKSTFVGLNIKSALKDQIPIQIGMFGTKFFAKLFGPEATEMDPSSWNWSSYAKGAAGAVAAGFVAQTIKPGMGQKVLQGGLSLIFYKMIQNNLVTGNDFAEKHFGIEQEDDDIYIPDEYAEMSGYGENDYEPGDVEDDESGNSYLLGDDYEWHALPESSGPMMGDELRKIGPLGETYEHLSPPSALGQVDPVAQALLD